MDKVRRLAREEQRTVEQARLMAHQKIGGQLLSHPDQAKQLLSDARAEVRRWRELQLCSEDYIDRWNDWLERPVPELVDAMCSDAQGWGSAMRQNSPFAVSFR